MCEDNLRLLIKANRKSPGLFDSVSSGGPGWDSSNPEDTNDAMLLSITAMNALHKDHSKFKKYFREKGNRARVQDLLHQITQDNKRTPGVKYVENIPFTKTDVGKFCTTGSGKLSSTIAYNSHTDSQDVHNYRSKIVVCEEGWEHGDLPNSARSLGRELSRRKWIHLPESFCTKSCKLVSIGPGNLTDMASDIILGSGLSPQYTSRSVTRKLMGTRLMGLRC